MKLCTLLSAQWPKRKAWLGPFYPRWRGPKPAKMGPWPMCAHCASSCGPHARSRGPVRPLLAWLGPARRQPSSSGSERPWPLDWHWTAAHRPSGSKTRRPIPRQTLAAIPLLSLSVEAAAPKRPEGRRATAALPPLPAAVRSSAARTWPQPCHRPMASDPSSFPLSFPPTSGGGHGWPGKEVAALPRLSHRRARSPDGERAAVERAGDSALSSEPATHTSV